MEPLTRHGTSEGEAAPVTPGPPHEPAWLIRRLEPLAAAVDAERPRWFLWWPVLFGIGIALYFNAGTEPGLPVALGLPLAAAALLSAAGHRVWLSLAAGMALIVASGFAMAKLRTEWVRAPVLARQMGPVAVEGYVVLVEPRPGRGQRLTLDVTAIEGLDREDLPRRARIRTMQSLEGVRPGDHVSVTARIGPPQPPSMPGDYDFARAAWFLRLGAIGYAMTPARHTEPRPAETTLHELVPGDLGEIAPSPEGAVAEPAQRSWAARIERFRQAIGARVTAVLPGETGAIATALITGERGAITAATNDAFRDSGLLHILSISGLHMVVMAGAVFVLMRLAFAAVPAIALRFPTKKWAAFAAFVAAFCYLMISGASVATQRSWLMTSIMLIAVMLGRPALALRNVALAALAILAVAPESLNDVGFQMSFAAVISLIVVYDAARGHLGLDRAETPGPMRRVVLFFGGIALTTLAASFAVAPFAAFHFHKSQQYAVLANLVAIPVCNVLVMPAGLAALAAMPLGLEAAPLTLMGWGIALMTATAEGVSRLPGAVGYIPAFSANAFVVMVAGGLWFVLWRKRWRYVGLAVVALGAMLVPFSKPPDLLVGRDGALVALRGQDGALSFVAGRGTGFAARRWLEHDGDPRGADAARKGGAFRCDPWGCTGRLGDWIVAVPRHPSAIRDDCRKADILILDIPTPAWCRHPSVIIDYVALRDGGTHAIYLSETVSRSMPPTDVTGITPAPPNPAVRDGLRIEVLNTWRGDRPWVLGPAASRERSEPAPGARAGTTRRDPRRPSDDAVDGTAATKASAPATETEDEAGEP